MFNIAPIEKHANDSRVADIRKDPFAYTYFYGLFVHKLAHFFDVVHGTRHDFFTTEYRALYMLDWLELLERRGFDPAQVAQLPYAQHHLWNIVL